MSNSGKKFAKEIEVVMTQQFPNPDKQTELENDIVGVLTDYFFEGYKYRVDAGEPYTLVRHEAHILADHMFNEFVSLKLAAYSAAVAERVIGPDHRLLSSKEFLKAGPIHQERDIENYTINRIKGEQRQALATLDKELGITECK